MSSSQSAPFANGTAVIPLGAGAGLAWHEIALSFFAVDGVTPYPGAVTGSATMSAIGAFSDVEEAGANPLDLATQRRWAPFMSGVRQISVTVAGAPADARCVATVTTSST
jgi:hypothetical protein